MLYFIFLTSSNQKIIQFIYDLYYYQIGITEHLIIVLLFFLIHLSSEPPLFA